MKMKELSGLTKKRVKSAIATALALTLSIPTAAVINNVSVNAGTELPNPVKVYDFSDTTGLQFGTADNNPTIATDATRGKVLELQGTVSGAASTVSLPNPFAGRTSLVEYPTFASNGAPIWEKGVTVSYWQKTTGEDSSVFSFNLTRNNVLQKDDKTKYLLFQKYQENPNDPWFSLGTPTKITFSGGIYNGLKVNGANPIQEYTVYLNLGMFAKFNPNYTGGGWYLQKTINSMGKITGYNLVSMGDPIKIDNYGTIMSSTSKLKYGTEKSGLQFNSSGSWGFIEGPSNTQRYTNGVKLTTPATDAIGALNSRNQAAAYAYTAVSDSVTKEEISRTYVNDSPIKTPGTWHYITLVIKNDSISTYIDGVLKDNTLYTNRATVEAVDSNKGFNLGYGYNSLETGITKLNSDIHLNDTDTLATPENGKAYFSVYTDKTYPNKPIEDFSQLGYNGNTVSATIMEIITNPNATLQLGGTANAMNEIYMDKGTSAGTSVDNMAFFTEPLSSDQVTALYEKAKTQDLVGVDQPIETQAPTTKPSTAPTATPTSTVTGSPAPVTDTPTPTATPTSTVTVSPAPVSDTPAPVSDTPAPVSDTPAPVSDTPSPVTNTPAPNYKLGDVDGNNSVDLADANTVLKAALNIVTLTGDNKLAADVDKNNSIDLTDANMVLKAALNIITLN